MKSMLTLDSKDPYDIPYKFGVVTSFSDSLGKNVNVTPIPSLPTDCAFPLESSASRSFSIGFSRKAPDCVIDRTDMDTWPNSSWAKAVLSLANRWQARTDGYTMRFNCDDDGAPVLDKFPAIVDENVYLRSIEIDVAVGEPELLTGRLSLVVGGITNIKGAFDDQTR